MFLKVSPEWPVVRNQDIVCGRLAVLALRDDANILCLKPKLFLNKNNIINVCQIFLNSKTILHKQATRKALMSEYVDLRLKQINDIEIRQLDDGGKPY